MQKGQAAVELLIILAVSMAILIAMYSYSSNSIAEINKQKLVDQGQTSVNLLTSGANDVYRQGVGAKKQVFYNVPAGINESKSGIEANSFVLNVLGSDIYSKPDVCLQGTLPTEVGGHTVWLTALEECVFVGTENITVDKTSSYVTVLADDSATDDIVITNQGSETATVFITQSWTHSDVTLSANTAKFTLSSGAQQTVTLTYTSSIAASGNYPGTLNIGAAFPTKDENISLPANAEIVVQESALLLFPVSYSISIRENQSEVNDLNVCNNSETTMTNISFTNAGDIETWLSAIDPILMLGAGSCVTASFTTTVPNGKNYGSYTGSITGSDDGGSSDSTAITVTVPQMTSDFSFDWSTASFVAAGLRLWEWSITNNGSGTITIDKMTVTWWYDTEGATLENIKLNNDSVWSTGGGTNGQEIDITNFDIPASTSYTAQNQVEYSQRVDNESEDFQILFEFNDGSTYTTSVYSVDDVLPPVIALEAPADANTHDNYSALFSYNVTDASSGITSCELIIDSVSDQTDSTITEGITQYFSKTFASNATYTWDVSCTDDSISLNQGTSGATRQIIINVTAAPSYAMFTPTAGTDTTSGSYSLVSGNLTNVDTSDDSEYQSQGNWPKQGAGYSSYIEYDFTPSVPGGATITDANVSHEFSLNSGSGTAYAKLQIWDGSTWTDEILLSSESISATDVIHTINVSSYIDTPTKANAITVRFLMYFTGNTNKKSEEDLVSFGVTYTS